MCLSRYTFMAMRLPALAARSRTLAWAGSMRAKGNALHKSRGGSRGLCGCGPDYCAHEPLPCPRALFVDTAKCTGCGRCITPARILSSSPWMSDLPSSSKDCGVCLGRSQAGFHISLIMDVSPYCDCYSTNERPSCRCGCWRPDPVALDWPAPAANQQPPNPDSLLVRPQHHGDHFHAVCDTDWQASPACRENLPGARDYELITVNDHIAGADVVAAIACRGEGHLSPNSWRATAYTKTTGA